MENVQERRRFVRLNALVDVVYTKLDNNLEREKLSFIRNIGNGGICLIAYEEVKLADILKLSIYLPEDKTLVYAVGRVVWVKEFIIGDMSKGKRFDIGTEFIEIKNEDRDKIDKYIFTHL